MGHNHHHHHADIGDRKVAAAVGVNILLTVAQIIGGILSGSLALIADALHNLSDAIALIIAFAARRISRRPADNKMTFGYGRIEVIAALINYTTLIIVGIWLAVQAIERFITPEPISGWPVVWLAALALIIDLITAALTYSLAKDSINIRAAFLHNLADALGSVAVIVAGIIILTKGWLWIDPAITLLIAGYILWLALTEIKETIHILMMGAPDEVSPEQAKATIRAVAGVASVHNLRVWSIDEHQIGLMAHVVIDQAHWGNAAWIKDTIKLQLETEHHVDTIAIELETAPEVCPQTPHDH